jgi:N-acetylneuraminic acid mutarotase
MKHGVVILTGLVLAACGGGGGGGTSDVDNGISAWVRILEPIDGNGTFSTRAPSIEISGNAFVSPDDADCVTIQPVQLTLTWRNDSTGQNGRGSIRSFCQDTFLGFQRVSSWIIPEGDIDLQFGDNVVNIAAEDNAGNRGTATINVIREQDVVAPVIVGRSPAPDSLDAPVTSSITVTFSEAMLQSSLTADRFTVTDPDGFAVDGLHSYDANNFRWTFEPQFDLLYSTNYTVTISGLVEDTLGGNTMGGDVSWSFTTAPNLDVTPPEVTEVNPDPGAACVATDVNVLAAFDEPLDASSVNGTTFTLTETGGTSIDATVTYDGTTAVLDPLLPLIAGTGYDAKLTTGITDLAGNALGAEFSWSFTTASSVAIGAWSGTSPTGAPFERRDHTAVWSGSEVIIFGGHGWDQSIGAFVDTNTGGRYDPALDTWGAISTSGAPILAGHSAVFTGVEMFVWGGDTNTGARYDPGTDTWQSMTSVGAPSPRSEHAAVWTGSVMIVWGGESPGGNTLDTGARYDPSTDTWAPISTLNAPSPRRDMVYAWTGLEFIVWGGTSALSGGTELADGARYDPVSDTWGPLSADGGTGGRRVEAVWTGAELVVWDGGNPTFIGTDGLPVKTPTLTIYDPGSDTWRATTNLCEPYLGATEFHAHWTGSRMFAWSSEENGGYFYDPASDSWEPIDSLGGPPPRSGAASVWAGNRFVLWGGQEPFGLQDTGFVFRE